MPSPSRSRKREMASAKDGWAIQWALGVTTGSSARAIGGACRANPLPLIIPCHRVVASNGIGGYSGETGGTVLDVKRWLLDYEQARW